MAPDDVKFVIEALAKQLPFKLSKEEREAKIEREKAEDAHRRDKEKAEDDYRRDKEKTDDTHRRYKENLTLWSGIIVAAVAAVVCLIIMFSPGSNEDAKSWARTLFNTIATSFVAFHVGKYTK